LADILASSSSFFLLSLYLSFFFFSYFVFLNGGFCVPFVA
jgi:hypothetical protein